ncbi:GNAT family N-acetyltransferase [Paenibacillus sp. JX-17]|uniref:GNAT family N-acetyltransferase n=1 Tax=Paenibacillus lacisoli TaxID=3064525 RepID=A0ABT9C6V8_9BACL|nr:GNAT family N-acetyltransferase [Paenibacillus sp. JX-17]MDO7905000.1 GNAT family N-acetyltransferase [Paenibacillus sp. JX-17]
MSNNVYAPSFTIRPSCLQDCEAITSLLREVSYPTTFNVMKERMQGIEAENHSIMLVAELEEKVVGFISLQRVQSKAYPDPAAQITMLVVSRDHRYEGIGKRLVERGEQWGREQEGVQLFITGANRERHAEAHAFYERIGFDKKGYRLSKKI